MQYKKLFICPDCHHKLKKRTLICPKCRFKCKEENGIYHLHSNNSAWQKCEIEKSGWIDIHKELGIYRENDDHYYLPDGRPHLEVFYKEAKRSIDKLLEVENLENKLCLDLGAGIGWVECYILKQVESELIAVECSDDKFVGLGRSIALKKFYNCDFMSVVADMHNIPIADNSIDIVFMVDALHHFTDLNKVLAEAYRVLKPGGHFWAINEAHRPENIDELKYIQEHVPMESKHGISERRPTINEYLQAGEILKLQVLNDKLNFIAPGLILYGEKNGGRVSESFYQRTMKKLRSAFK